MAAQLGPTQQHSLCRTELQMWEQGAHAFKRGRKSGFQPREDRHPAGELPGQRVMRFLTGDSRGDGEIKRGLGHRPDLGSVSARLPGQPGNWDFPAP